MTNKHMKTLQLLNEYNDPYTAAKSKGYDVDDVLYHGTNRSFNKFDRKFAKTASHIYTSHDPMTASNYGSNVYIVAPKIGKLADLTEDYDLLNKIAAEIKDDFSDVRYEYKTFDSMISDSELPSTIHTIAKEAKDFAANWISNYAKENGVDLEDAEHEFDFSDEKEQMLDSLHDKIAYLKALAILHSHKIYEYDNGKLQDRVMDICFGMGYDCVCFYDYSSAGEPVSYVFDDPEKLYILGKYK